MDHEICGGFRLPGNVGVGLAASREAGIGNLFAAEMHQLDAYDIVFVVVVVHRNPLRERHEGRGDAAVFYPEREPHPVVVRSAYLRTPELIVGAGPGLACEFREEGRISARMAAGHYLLRLAAVEEEAEGRAPVFVIDAYPGPPCRQDRVCQCC